MKNQRKPKKTTQINHTKPCIINKPKETDKFILFSFSDSYIPFIPVPTEVPANSEKFFATLRVSNRFPFIHLTFGDTE